jgi:hypothetical protein
MKKKPARHRLTVVPPTDKTFVDVLVENDELREKFRMTAIDQALRKAIEECRLFVMPENHVFAYCRGTGPIGMAKVRAGAYEDEVDAAKPLPKRRLSLDYRVRLFNTEEEQDTEVTVHVSLPYRFTGFAEEQDKTYKFPKTKVLFFFDPTDLNVWIAEQQMEIYAKAEAEVHEQIAKLKARAKHISENSRKTKPYAPSQSGF